MSLPPSGMASRALTARLMITCSNCATSALTGQRSRTCGDLERHVLADQALEQHGEIRQRLAEIEHLRAHGLLARERQQLPHQARRPVGILLDLHDVLERRIGRLVRVEQEVGRHHDGAEQIVEVVRDVAGEPADGLHLLLLVDLVLQRALLRGLERIDDRRLLVALALLLDRGDEEAREALARARERGVDRRDLALPVRRLADRGLQHAAIALGDDREDRAVAVALALEHRVEQPREPRVRARDPALLVHRGDRHRRVLEEAHEAHLGGALRIGAVVACAVEDEGARGTRRAVGAEGDLVEQPHRNRPAAAGLEVDVEHLGLHVARHRRQRGEQRGALAGHDVVELEAAGADLREVVVEPVGQRGIE